MAFCGLQYTSWRDIDQLLQTLDTLTAMRLLFIPRINLAITILLEPPSCDFVGWYEEVVLVPRVLRPGNPVPVPG
jgi:hypothetical protein